MPGIERRSLPDENGGLGITTTGGRFRARSFGGPTSHQPPQQILSAPTLRLSRLRTLLFSLSTALFIGTVVELLLAQHYDEPIQLVPFALCALGMVAVGAA